MDTGGVREIPLTKGYVALVDEADYAWVSQWKWHVCDDGRGHVYAVRNSDGVRVYLHREIAKTPKGLITDHIDGNTLRCTRDNLRSCSLSGNARNRRRRANSAFPYKGVSCQKGRWLTSIFVGGKRIYFCGFDTAEDAARAYDKAALEHYGEFARLNFPKAA